jgi:4'-phosphopantetheinyl transferase
MWPDKTAHVWRIDVGAVPIDRWRDLLDPDERSKTDRFQQPADRSRYLAAHLSLRMILSRYLEIEANQIQYTHNPFGKPAVLNSSLEFSLSHSAEVILIAVADGHSIGVDVERIRADFDYQPIVSQYFSAREKSTLSSLPPDRQRDMFYTLWTRKEAVLKMFGQGMSLLEHVEVIAVDGSFNLAQKDWAVYPIDVGAEYAASLAVAGQIDRIEYEIF